MKKEFLEVVEKYLSCDFDYQKVGSKEIVGFDHGQFIYRPKSEEEIERIKSGAERIRKMLDFEF